MRAFMVLYESDEGDDDYHPYKSGRSAERRVFSLLSSVCWQWHQTLVGWPQSTTRHWVKHQIAKLIER